MSILKQALKMFRDSGRRRRPRPPRAARARPELEALDGRILPSVTEFSIPGAVTPRLEGITRGPDGNLWFTENFADRIGRITPAGVVTEFALPFLSGPGEITAGPDGNLWFTEASNSRIGRITPAGLITEFSAGITPNSAPGGITRGPDGNLWFTETRTNKIGRITPAGVVTEFSAGITPGTTLQFITAGPDGNVWFTQQGNSTAVPGAIGRITPAGVFTEFSAGLSLGGQLHGITTGPDGNLWFTEALSNLGSIGRITPAGAITEAVTIFGGSPQEITTGPDGNLWFTELSRSRIGRLTTAGALTEFAAGISTASSPWGIAAGPDGNIWFAESGGSSAIGRLNLAQSPNETTTTLRTSAATVVVGQTVTLTATVTALGGGAVTNGIVDFYIGNTRGPSASLDANGQASVDLTGVSAGTPAALKAVLRSNAFPASTSGVVTVTVIPAAAPQVSGVVVNGGAAQRSLVNQVRVAFDQHVTLPANPAGAFRLARQSDGAAVTLAAAVDDSGTGTVVTLTFVGGAVNGASLADGRYTLTVLAGQVGGPNGALDGNGDGTGGDNFVLAGDPATNKLFCLFGDVNGDGAVNGLDLAAFRGAFGTTLADTAYVSFLDSSGDGTINGLDLAQFRARFGVSV